MKRDIILGIVRGELKSLQELELGASFVAFCNENKEETTQEIQVKK